MESTTKVVLGGRRGGPEVSTLREDRWWIQPVVTMSILTAFVIYSTWAAFQNRYYYVGANVHRDLISPFYSPCIASDCVTGVQGRLRVQRMVAVAGVADPDLPAGFSTHVLLLPSQLLPRLLVVAAVVRGRGRARHLHRRDALSPHHAERPPLLLLRGTGLQRAPLPTTRFARSANPVRGGASPWARSSLVVNACLLWAYSLSCHACRHLCGGGLKKFSSHPLRYRFWKLLTPLNAKHMNFAWASLDLRGAHRRVRAPGRVGRPDRLQDLLGARNP